MRERTSFSDRISDFLFTTVWLSLLNYFEVFVNYEDVSQRLFRSVLVAAAAGFVLALIRPTINGWIRPIIKKNRGTKTGLLISFIIFTVFFGAFTFVSLLQYKNDPNWGVARILTRAYLTGLVSGVFFSLVLWVIRKRKTNNNELPDQQ
jgi:MFS family permease